MGVLTEGKKKKDRIAVATDTIEKQGTGVLKQSRVTVVDDKPIRVDPQAFVVGLRVARGQRVAIVAAPEPGYLAEGRYLVTASIVTSGEDVGPHELRR